VLRNRAGNEPDQAGPEPSPYLPLQAFPITGPQIIRETVAAVGDHLGQAAELGIGQGIRAVFRFGARGGPGKVFAWHCGSSGGARMPAANRNARFGR
jgi:hypothetical protein